MGTTFFNIKSAALNLAKQSIVRLEIQYAKRIFLPNACTCKSILIRIFAVDVN